MVSSQACQEEIPAVFLDAKLRLTRKEKNGRKPGEAFILRCQKSLQRKGPRCIQLQRGQVDDASLLETKCVIDRRAWRRERRPIRLHPLGADDLAVMPVAGGVLEHV